MKRFIAALALASVVLTGCGPKIGALPKFPKQPPAVEISKMPDPEKVCHAGEKPFVFFKMLSENVGLAIIFCGIENTAADDGLGTVFVRRGTFFVVPDSESESSVSPQNMKHGIDYNHDPLTLNF